jgi:bacteriocin-like protein
MRPILQALLSRLHGGASQELAARPRAGEDELSKTELAQVTGGGDGGPGGPGDNNGVVDSGKASPILM